MANVLSLALKINADASGLKLDPVSKALRQLGEETDRVSGIFDKFTSTSEAAARAQAATEQALNDLIAARKAGTVTATEFAESFRAVEEAAKRQAAEFQRGADITERYTTEEEKRARTLAELEQLLAAGAIKEDVYARAVADASGATAAAAEAEKQRFINNYTEYLFLYESLFINTYTACVCRLQIIELSQDPYYTERHDSPFLLTLVCLLYQVCECEHLTGKQALHFSINIKNKIALHFNCWIDSEYHA